MVAVVVIGIGDRADVHGGDDKKSNGAEPTATPSFEQSQQAGGAGNDKGKKPDKPLPKQDAATLQLGPPAVWRRTSRARRARAAPM